MSAPRRRPIYDDDEALKLIDRLLADWMFAQDEHLTEKQQEKKWWAREKAKQAAAIATARDGNYWPLIRLWRKEKQNLSEEAEQLIAERPPRSHRRGPAHGTNYSPNRLAAKWVPAIKEILRVFYFDLLTERERSRFAIALTAKYLEIDVARFGVFWGKKYKKGSPSSVIDYLLACSPEGDPNQFGSPPTSATELNRFRKHLVLERKLYLKHKEESRKIFPRLFAE